MQWGVTGMSFKWVLTYLQWDMTIREEGINLEREEWKMSRTRQHKLNGMKNIAGISVSQEMLVV